jgi:hypothetical protein
MDTRMRRFRTSAWGFCLLSFLALWTWGQVSYGQTAPKKAPTLSRVEGKVEISVDGENRARMLLQYQGRANATATRAYDDFIIQSSEELRELLSAYGYGSMPGVDFQRDLVVHIHSRQRQCAELVIDSLAFREHKLLGAKTTEYTCSNAENEGKRAFSLAVLPRNTVER